MICRLKNTFINVCKINTSFGSKHILYLQNPDINEFNCTKIISEMIKSKILAEEVKLLEFNVTTNFITIVSDEDTAHIIARSMINSSFATIETQKVNSDILTHYQTVIKIINIDKLLSYLNRNAFYPLYKLTNNIPYFKENTIAIEVDNLEEVETIKNNIKTSNKVSLRFDGEKYFPQYSGGFSSSGFSEPILQDGFNNQIIEKVSIYDKNKLIMHLSPWALEKINNIRVKNPGRNIHFEIGGIVYASLNLKGRKSIPSDMHLVTCKTHQEAKQLLKKLNIGYFSSMQIIKEETKETSNYKLMYFLIFLNLILICLFLLINQKKKLLIALILSLIIFLYFNISYQNCLTGSILFASILQILLFILITKVKNNITLDNNLSLYLIVGYFVINLILYGLGITLNNIYLDFMTKNTLNSSLISFLTYYIIFAIKLKKSNE